MFWTLWIQSVLENFDPSVALRVLTLAVLLVSESAAARLQHFKESNIQYKLNGKNFYRTCSYSGQIRSSSDQAIIDNIVIYIGGGNSNGIPFIELRDTTITDPTLVNKLRLEYVKEGDRYLSQPDDTFARGNKDIFGKSRVLMKESQSAQPGITGVEFYDVDSNVQASLISMPFLWDYSGLLKPRWDSFTKIAEGQVTDVGCAVQELPARQ